MRVMKAVRLPVLGLALVVVGVIAVNMAQVQPGRSATKDPLTDEYAATFGITFDGLDAVQAGAAVSVAQATRVAQDYFATGEAPAGVRHGRAAQYVNSPVRSVWIVSFAGGSMPNAGPSMVPDLPAQVTGVVVDDRTGEVLRAFFAGPPVK